MAAGEQSNLFPLLDKETINAQETIDDRGKTDDTEGKEEYSVAIRGAG